MYCNEPQKPLSQKLLFQVPLFRFFVSALQHLDCYYNEYPMNQTAWSLHKKWSFPLTILLVNVTKTSFFVQCVIQFITKCKDVITKCDSYFITKCDRSLLQNASSFLLRNTTVLMQNVTVVTKCDDFIIKCDSYYKMRRLLQIATIQWRKRLVCFKYSLGVAIPGKFCNFSFI